MAKVKADLHNHLRTSGVFRDRDFNRTIDAASRRLGIGAVVGIINFADKRYETFVGLRGHERDYVGENKNGTYIPGKGVLIIKGQEVPTKQGHLLVLGLGHETHLKQNRPLEDTLKEARDNNGIVVVDHPFYVAGLGKCLETNPDMLERIDAIEIHNGEASLGLPVGPFPYGANRQAQEFYRRAIVDYPHLGAIASSDGHSLYELGSSWTEIEVPNREDKHDFVESLRRAIRGTTLGTPKKMRNSVFGAIDHIAKLMFISKIAPKIGLRNLFETERPENI